MFTKPEIFVARLTEVEKSKIRGATEDGFEWLFRNRHRAELAGTDEEAFETFSKARDMVNQASAEASASDKFGRTWAF